ncbi:MAG: transposase [Spirochaetales bacterium]|nr:transposase [Spirochaetales bacterium]
MNYEVNEPTLKTDPILLITDGGPENKGEVKTYLNTVPIKQIIAQKDIKFSNCMVEAVNKRLKYNFLFHQKIPVFKELEKHLACAVTEFNNVRPMGVLGGLTPQQVLQGQTTDKEKNEDRSMDAAVVRIRENQVARCEVCRV